MQMNLFKDEMAKKHITQDILAHGIGISVNSVNRKLNKKSDWTLGEWLRACELVGVDDPLKYA
jgi:DNA-binding XRE family transcriptional regulator